MDTQVSYDLADGVATLTMDDGKVNVMSLQMQRALHAAFDRAAADGAAVVLTGRTGVFSAGFDLATLNAGGAEAEEMARGGFALAGRVLAHPHPTVAACTGHAVAMGAFLMFGCDYRIGAAGPSKMVANEVAIGIPLPEVAITILRSRLHPSALSRATMLAEVFTPDDAVQTGWLDRVVPADELLATAQSHAKSLAAVNNAAHATTKLRLRQPVLDAIDAYLASGESIVPTAA